MNLNGEGIPIVDYYERDRNACRPSFCEECGSGGGSGKPYLPRPQPTKYYPEAHSYEQSHPGNDHSVRPASPISSDTRPTTYRPIEKPYLPHNIPSNHPGNIGYHNNGNWFHQIIRLDALNITHNIHDIHVFS